MSYDLRCFGWENCIIPHTLKAVQSLLPRWNQLKILRKKHTDDEENLRLVSNFFYNTVDGHYMPAYTKGALIGDGSYANIYLGKRGIFKPEDGRTDGIIHIRRDMPMDDICIKEIRLLITDEERDGSPNTRRTAYEDEMRAILHEAFLHALVIKTFESVNMAKKVPKLYEVVGVTRRGLKPTAPQDFESVWMVMEMLRGHTLEKYLRIHLVPQAFQENETVLIDIFIQLAHCLHILQTKLRFNHRDIKLNNLFVRYHAEDDIWEKELNIENYGPYTCRQDIIIFDFGFSCIGCSVENTAIVSAGSWFDKDDLCFKQGRDLCQFLYALNVFYPLHKFVSQALLEILTYAMTVTVDDVSINLFNGVDIDGAPQAGNTRVVFNQGIYTFLKQAHVAVHGCEPLTFLAMLRAYNRV